MLAISLRRNFAFLFLIFTVSILQFSCGNPQRPEDDGSTNVFEYETVFPADSINRIDIVLSSDTWQRLIDDMEDNYGERGLGSAEDGFDAFWDVYWDTIEWSDEDPIWVECTVNFSDQTWEHVGFRLKGASSLLAAWWKGGLKLPFKLDFDQFESEYPEVKNQRFYGFKKLSFTNAIFDESYMRRKVAADLFREGGVTAGYTAFYRVYFDKGDGPIFIGVYVVEEYPQKSLFMTQLGDTGGNLYKPSSLGADAWWQTYEIDNYSFSKKTNEEEGDFSDIMEAVDAVNASRTDIAVWRSNFNATFDLDNLMKWLALNTVLANSDVSGNHYLYADPTENGKLHWIPWDFDSCFPDWDNSGMTDPFLGETLLLDLSNVDGAIPPISYPILDDDVSREIYRSTVEAFSEGNFKEETMKARFQKEYDLIEPYVTAEDPLLIFTNKDDFADGLQEIFDFIDERNSEIDTFLSSGW